MDAEDLLLRQFLGIRTDERDAAVGASGSARSSATDGTWANFYGGPGRPVDDGRGVRGAAARRRPARRRAHAPRRASSSATTGGIERTRVFTRIWLALVRPVAWDDLPVLPPEMIFLPRGSRSTSTTSPAGRGRRSCRSPSSPPVGPCGPCRSRSPSCGPAARTAVRAARPRGRRVLPAPRPGAARVRAAADSRRCGAHALRRAERWIVERQEADGSWGGIQPPWVYSLIALQRPRLPARPSGDRDAACAAWTASRSSRATTRRLEACQSPVWDTALALIALADAGLPPDHAALERGGQLAASRRRSACAATGRCAGPRLEPGGWAFEFENDHYPDIDDTAEVVLALAPRVDAAGVGDAAVDAASRWTLGMQSTDGGWGAFDADNTRELCRKLPFCDFGEVIDPPCADVTAHVVEMLAGEGMAGGAAARARRRVAAARAGAGRLVVRPLGRQLRLRHRRGRARAGRARASRASSPRSAAPSRWLERVQNADGGWGEDLRSYDDRRAGAGAAPRPRRRPPGRCSRCSPRGRSAGDRRARGRLARARPSAPDGGWDEPQFTGTGFPGDFYINYHLYRLVFPVMALGRLVNTAG